ncbi:MAG: hypothetical protein ACRC7O_18890 [Fimbriiglobus sp.]
MLRLLVSVGLIGVVGCLPPTTSVTTSATKEAANAKVPPPPPTPPARPSLEETEGPAQLTDLRPDAPILAERFAALREGVSKALPAGAEFKTFRRTRDGQLDGVVLRWNSRTATAKTARDLNADRPGRHVDLHASLTDFHLMSSATTDGGWGAYQSYYYFPKWGHFNFDIVLYHPELAPVKSPTNGFHATHVRFSSKPRTYRGRTYSVNLLSPAANRSNKPEPLAVVDAGVRRYLASPESYRDATLAEIGRVGTVEDLTRAILSGTVVSETIHYPNEGGIPPYSREESPPRHPLTDAEAAEMAAECEKYLDGQRALVREHFREMHAAAKAAFPLDEYLPESPRP